MLPNSILITGGSGFIGSHVVEYLLQNTEYKIIIVDRLDSTSTQHRLLHLNYHLNRINFIYHNLRSPFPDFLLKKLQNENIKYVLHLAASTHVDRSISYPLEFIYDNIHGTHNILWACTELKSVEKIINFSTDEVFGSAINGENFKEWDRYKSGNPYAATKAGAEELGIAYHNTYGLPVITTHTMNVFGERQHPEKFIPKVIHNILHGLESIIHSDKTCTIPGSRYYLYTHNVCQALLYLLEKGHIGDKYNIVGWQELNNLEIVQLIGQILGKRPLYKLVDFHSSRPGHDLRYALDGSKLSNMGFRYDFNLQESMTKVVNWYLENKDWLMV